MYEKSTPRILEENFKLVLSKIRKSKASMHSNLIKKRDRIEKELGIMYNEIMGER